MVWQDWVEEFREEEEEAAAAAASGEEEEDLHFDFFSLLSNPKKWHPDKRKDQDSSTSRFQEINEAYKVLGDPAKRREYDRKGMLYIYDRNFTEYLDRHKALILTCNGLGIKHSIW